MTLLEVIEVDECTCSETYGTVDDINPALPIIIRNIQ